MANGRIVTTMSSLILIACLSGAVLANDAGSGGDAGNSTTSAYSLNATNATYFGNLTDVSDEDDYYSISMPNNTGIYVELVSPGYSGSNGTNSSSTCSNASWPFYTCDFDLELFNSAGTQLDYSVSSSGYDDVTSNGTSVGGSTVYIRAYHYDGDGQYALIVNIFSTSTGGGGGGGNNSTSLHDAGRGYDAGNTYSTAMNLSAINQSLWGDVHSTTDSYDYYRITVPSQHGFALSLDWNGTSGNPDLDLELYDANGSLLVYSWFSKPESLGPYNGSGGITYNIGVTAYSGSGDYLLNLTFDNLSTSPIYNQNDAGTGDDASDDYNNPTTLNTSIGENYYNGWASDSGDTIDQYSSAVPANHGIAISLSFDDTLVNFNLLLAQLPNPQNNIIDSSSTFYSPETVTSNGTYVGGTSVLVQVSVDSGNGDYGLTIWIFDLDSDGDGHWDDNETACGSDPDNANSVPTDTDGDGVCDFLDSDDDGDGYNDTDDAFPLDSSEWLDTDGDQIGDNSDDDDDDDGWSDLDEYRCGTDSLDYASQPLDTDGDAICDVEDEDDDNDGYPDTSDAFPLDDEEWTDTDGDNIGNNADTDDDGDGFSDSTESTCGSDSLDADSIPADLDQDGSCDAIDGDDDNDGYADISDAFPLDPNEWVDTDGDNIGDNADLDDDGDSVVDSSDAFPLDPSEWEDTDGDNIGDNSDLDDDGDGWSDSDEIECQTDPYSSISIPVDYDNDNVCDRMDSDDDGDGVEDIYDMFQFDASEWDDLDLDGVGDNADLDDDGDGWNDIDEPNCGTNPNDANSFPSDFDMDGICDTLDPDDDNDLVLDINDDFQFDPSEHEDYDGDGIGDNADTDDDDDGWSDDLEAICQTIRLSETSVPLDTDGDGTCDVIDADDDGDGVGDPNDAFPKDPDEWEDRNGDGLGDRANPLSIIDHMKLNPIITGIVIFAILGAIGATAVLRARKTSPSPEDAWRDDDYSRYEETPSLVQEDSIPVEDTTDSSSATDELPDEESENSDIASDSTPTVKPPPPPPPGFEDVDFSDQKLTTRVENWEDLPDGGDYVQTEPMRYVGEECGTWIRQEDDSWILEE